MPATPWAILLCRFNDDTSAEIYPRQRFDEIFTTAGHGKFNMVDYFRDVSHGHVDLSGSRVFPPSTGWYRLTQKTSDYLGPNTPIHGRSALLAWARAAAAANNDDLTAFFNIVVVTNPPADLYGGLAGVATGDARNPLNGMTSLSASMLGQEMAHGYGLDHARMEGSLANYADRFDIMSTARALMAPHAVYTERDVRGNPIFRIGPGLNAASMHAVGWLDPGRVWTAGSVTGAQTVQLRPLHRPDLPGFLCARVNDFFIEFRMNEGWDAGFPQPLVLVHDYFDGHSYLQLADDGNDSMTAGDTLSQGDVTDQPRPFHGGGLQITVTGIDPTQRTATIRVRQWRDQRLRLGPGRLIGAVANDGGGWLILNGKIVKVPPRSPLVGIMEQMLQVQQAEGLTHTEARGLAQQRAYQAIAEMAGTASARALSLREPTPQIVARVRGREEH